PLLLTNWPATSRPTPPAVLRTRIRVGPQAAGGRHATWRPWKLPPRIPGICAPRGSARGSTPPGNWRLGRGREGPKLGRDGRPFRPTAHHPGSTPSVAPRGKPGVGPGWWAPRSTHSHRNRGKVDLVQDDLDASAQLTNAAARGRARATN